MSALTPQVQFNGVWKKFKQGEVHDSLRDLIPALFKRTTNKVVGRSTLKRNEFWALKDVSFTVDTGQTLGVIGHNGAGKSTVLKVLTRILRPSAGSYHVHGRIGALIEIAAGFHPDLSGLENIYLQGAIMGMEHKQIKRKLDEIVAFSEIEHFLAMPVKRYSSGMNARLGFSIAAHLDPDVLIIDEVLAVGDFAFQKKAFGRIRELARSGMPVVVVSHQLDRVAELCTHALLLSHGAVLFHGPPTDAIGAYLRGASEPVHLEAGDAPVDFHSVEAVDGNETVSGGFVRVRVRGCVQGAINRHVEPVGVIVRSAQNGEMVFATGLAPFGIGLAKGDFDVQFKLQLNVQPGIYLVDIGTWDRASEQQLSAGPSLNLRVMDSRVFLGPTNFNASVTMSGEPVLAPT